MKQFIVKAKTLNIRQMPTVNSLAIGFLSFGDVIDALKISGDGKWVGFIRVTGNEQQKGWASLKFLHSLKNDNLIKPDDFPWTKIAIREIGTREFYENADNPRIVQYLMSTENINNILRSNDETAWCSAFVNWCMEASGIEGTILRLNRFAKNANLPAQYNCP
ncbi:MAG: SH3 domain-containing protein [Desulfobacula sp.]|nr:SH3 domain-containing protein [Desulfobacula sp.]